MPLKNHRYKLLLSSDKYAEFVPGKKSFSRKIKNHARLDFFSFASILRDPPVISSEWHQIGASVAGASVVADGRVGDQLYKRQKLFAGSQCVVMPALHDVFWEWDPLHSDDEHKARCTINLQLSDHLLKKVAEEVFQKDASRFELLSNAAFDDPVVYALLNEMHLQCAEEKPFSSIYLDSALNMLCVHLLSNRHLTSYNSTETLADFDRWTSGKSGKGLSKAALLKVRSYTMDNLNRPIMLKDLAKIAGLSEYHFMRLFKNATGISPYQYVIHCRIDRAKYLLAETTQSITDIALDVGFDDASNFSKTFRKLTGHSPSMYRKSVCS